MGSNDLYDEVLKQIHQDPETFLRENRLYQIAALKLQIPETLRAQKRLRRHHWNSFEEAVKEQKKREIEIALAVKSERDAISQKLKFHNRESREAELQDRLQKDAAWNRWEGQRASMYASVKKFDEDIDYYERMDQSLLEILAMFTSMIEFETRYERRYQSDARSTRSQGRTKQRAKVALGSSETSPLPS
jgi:hypothetical protein